MTSMKMIMGDKDEFIYQMFETSILSLSSGSENIPQMVSKEIQLITFSKEEKLIMSSLIRKQGTVFSLFLIVLIIKFTVD